MNAQAFQVKKNIACGVQGGNCLNRDFNFDKYSAQELFDLSEVIKEELVSTKGYPEVKGAVNFVKSLAGKFKLAVACVSFSWVQICV